MNRGATSDRVGARVRAWGAWAGISALTLMAYGPALGSGFVWDDDAHVTKASMRSLHGLWRIWFEIGATQQYYPVLHGAFWLEHRLWGDAPLGYHLTNVLLHATSAWLFALVLRRLAIPGAGLGALLFAVHPVCVESVAWVSEQKNTLSTVFYLLAALVYLRFERDRRPGEWNREMEQAGRTRRSSQPVRPSLTTADPASENGRRSAGAYAFATLLFLLALLSKTVTATLPAALLVVLWWRKGRLSWKADILPLLPWLGLGAGAGLFSAWVERAYIGAQGAAFSLDPIQRCLLAGRAVWFYLGKLLWPANLIFIYPRWRINASEGWQYLFPLAALALVAALWLLRRRTRAPLAAVLFFVGSLFPTLGFFNVFAFIYSYVTDHWQYLASLGIIALAAPVFARWTRATPRQIPARAWPRRNLAGALVIFLLGILTWRQCRMYRDQETFYRVTLERNPACWMAHNNLGDILARTGRSAEAVDHYRQALRLAPESAEIEFNLGDVLVQSGRMPEAAAAYREALRLQPDYASAHANLGHALVSLGRLAEAIPQYEQALRLRPDDADTESNLGLALAHTGRVAEAIAHYERSLQLRPDSPEAHNNWGSALASSGQLTAAIGHFATALQLRPNYAEARYNLANALGNAGRLPEAIAQYRELLRLQPDNAEAHANLGLALAGSERPSEALAELAAAVRLRPGYAEAHAYFGFALARAGRLPEAVKEYHLALGLNPNNSDAHYQLGVALRSLGQTAEAAEQFEAAERPAK